MERKEQDGMWVAQRLLQDEGSCQKEGKKTFIPFNMI
jgi:hypothetical protein